MRVGRVYDNEKKRKRKEKTHFLGCGTLPPRDKGSRGEVGYNYMLLETYLHKRVRVVIGSPICNNLLCKTVAVS